jgi:EAL domain-containing protein (putative c-di-GMP-specific phosphodiesterase class I)
MENFTLACDLLHELSTEGFSLAIDDFGTGYSSLAHLSRLPAGILKLDKSLIDDLESSLTTQTMLENIIRMAHDLDKIVVVEGVESAEQLQILKRLGCDQAQGFYLSRPLSQHDFEKLVFPVKE